MTRTLFDFRDATAAAGWRAIDDRVMGGMSSSRLQHDPEGHAVFVGVVSLAFGGGFASVRCGPAAFGQPDATRCRLEVRGDARTYKLNLLSDDAVDGRVHQAGFTAAPSRWQTVELPLADFRATFRGRELAGAPPLDPARVRQVGLMIGARQAGPFRLEIRRIELV